MTAPLVPSFLLKLFEAELHKVNGKIVDRICDLYNLNKKDVHSKLGKMLYTEVEVEQDKKMKVIKVTPQKEITDDERCTARYYNKEEKQVMRCKKKAKMQCFCMSHYNLSRQDYLRYGTIHKPIDGDGPNFNVVKKYERDLVQQEKKKVALKKKDN